MHEKMHRSSVIAILAILCLSACSKQGKISNAYHFLDCPKAPLISNASTIKSVFSTESGMHGLWSPNAFARVCDLAAWERIFLKNEQIEPFIRQGSFVPVYVHEDGGALFELRVGSIISPAMPTLDESSWTTETSDPYLFQSDGVLALSGIEYLNGSPNSDVRAIPLPSGRWVVTIRVLTSTRRFRQEQHYAKLPSAGKPRTNNCAHISKLS
jgi:hypothetical protein